MIKIGWCKRDISTDKPIAIPGQSYMRYSKGVLDPVMATALTVDDGNDYVIFVSLDVVSAREDVLNSVRERVAQINPEIDTQKIIINATHTHAGPLVVKNNILGNLARASENSGMPAELQNEETMAELIGGYFDFFLEQVSGAICESFNSRKEGYISYGYGYAVSSHNRRVVYFKDMTEGSEDKRLRIAEGWGKMYGNSAIPEFSHVETGGNPYVEFMFTYDKDKKLTGAIVNVPCPSQNMELEYYLSSDFWGDIREILTERYGDINILPQCAAAGDLAPRPRYYGKAEERRFRLKYSDMAVPEDLVNPTEIYRRREVALQVCAAFDDVYEWASKEKLADVPISHSVKTINLEKRFITEEEYEYFNSLKDTDKDGNPRKNMMAKRYEEQKKEPTIPMEMHVIRVGNIAFATNQFELYMDYQHRIQARSPFEQTFIIQLCAQPGRRAGSYLSTERACASRGYGSNLFSNRVSPVGGQQLVEETLSELNKLYNEETNK